MSVTRQIRDRIKADLAGIAPSIGVIHEYERWAADYSKLIEFLKDEATGIVRGATISKESAPGNRWGPQQAERQPVYVIRLYRALDDAAASELAFDDDVETVLDTLGGDWTLGGLADYCDEPQLRVMEPRMFSGILCHYAEIGFQVHLTHAY